MIAATVIATGFVFWFVAQSALFAVKMRVARDEARQAHELHDIAEESTWDAPRQTHSEGVALSLACGACLRLILHKRLSCTARLS